MAWNSTVPLEPPSSWSIPMGTITAICVVVQKTRTSQTSASSSVPVQYTGHHIDAEPTNMRGIHLVQPDGYTEQLTERKPSVRPWLNPAAATVLAEDPGSCQFSVACVECCKESRVNRQFWLALFEHEILSGPLVTQSPTSPQYSKVDGVPGRFCSSIQQWPHPTSVALFRLEYRPTHTLYIMAAGAFFKAVPLPAVE